MSNVVSGDLRRNDGHVTSMQLFVAFCRLYEGGPMLLTTDEDILREVMVKGFHNFTNRKVMRHYANSILHFLHRNHKFREISFVNNIDFHGSLTKYAKRFPRHLFLRKPLVCDPGMHHGTCVTHVPWCMSGSLTPGGEENVPDIPGACATRNFAYLVWDPLILYCPIGKISNDWAIEKEVVRKMRFDISYWWGRVRACECVYYMATPPVSYSLQWCPKEHHGVSNQQRLDSLFNRLFRPTLKKVHITRPLWGEFFSKQRIPLINGQ